jgi:uracil-DNA glycosylase
MTDQLKIHNDDDWKLLDENIIACRLCPRLVEWREKVARERRRAYRNDIYWGKPVPGFGDHQARVIVVGLAPGAHGSNRTGRMFTGDASGVFLYAALNRAGFANQPTSRNQEDGLVLKDVFITAVCRCAPPENKPDKTEIINCQPYLLTEMDWLACCQGVVALGKLAFDRVLSIYRSQGHDIPPLVFGHNNFYELPGILPWLLASYHPSQQNTQTGRLTEEMFDQVWYHARRMLKDKA